MTIRLAAAGCVVASALFAYATGSAAAQCGNTGAGFSSWLAGFKSEAAAAGISAGAISALDGVGYDQKVINADRRQGVFAQSFLEFAGRMVADYRMSQGKSLLKKYAATFKKIEQEFGVPGPVIVAFWGLETDFGANLGDFRTLQSLATLAYDCRRPEQFTPELLAALKILDRGDLTAGEMKGAWAGEIGQTQFVPSYYFDFAVDYDGDGKRNLVKERAGRARFDREPLEASWMAGGSAVARRGARSGRHDLGRGGPRHKACALGVGGMGRDPGRRRGAVGR